MIEIKNRCEYRSAYDSSLLRGTDAPDTPRPWNLSSEILRHASSKKTLLDLGCGTAFKSILWAPYFHEIYGLDCSQSMLDAAENNARDANADNMKFLKGTVESLPFADQSVDVITSILSTWSTSELRRVLKRDGVVIIEFVGAEDKKEFKLLFGEDELGLRGQFLEHSMKHFINVIEQALSTHFDSISIKNGYWDTYYTIEGLKQLLACTPTIRNYNEAVDEGNLMTAIKQFSTESGIRLTQNRILIHAKHPKPT